MKPTVCRNRVRTMKPLLMHLVIPRTAECWYSRCFTLFRCFAVAEGTVQRKAHNAPHVRELHQAPCTIVVSLQCDRLSSADRFVAFQPFASIHSITVSHDNMERRPGLGSDVTTRLHLTHLWCWQSLLACATNDNSEQCKTCERN